jgi:cysteinyl-tRNA synthetase
MNETSEQWNEFKKKRVSITDTEIKNMLSLRDKARENKNYKEADRIRDELLDKGVLIEDKDGKTLWKFK